MDRGTATGTVTTTSGSKNITTVLSTGTLAIGQRFVSANCDPGSRIVSGSGTGGCSPLQPTRRPRGTAFYAEGARAPAVNLGASPCQCGHDLAGGGRAAQSRRGYLLTRTAYLSPSEVLAPRGWSSAGSTEAKARRRVVTLDTGGCQPDGQSPAAEPTSPFEGDHCRDGIAGHRMPEVARAAHVVRLRRERRRTATPRPFEMKSAVLRRTSARVTSLSPNPRTRDGARDLAGSSLRPYLDVTHAGDGCAVFNPGFAACAADGIHAAIPETTTNMIARFIEPPPSGLVARCSRPSSPRTQGHPRLGRCSGRSDHRPRP